MNVWSKTYSAMTDLKTDRDLDYCHYTGNLLVIIQNLFVIDYLISLNLDLNFVGELEDVNRFRKLLIRVLFRSSGKTTTVNITVPGPPRSTYQ